MMYRISILFFSLLLSTGHLCAQESPENDPGKPYLIKSIYFGGGSYYIDGDQSKSLYEFFDGVILENYEIHIHSHTDIIGGREYNEWLSMMRSQMSYEIIAEGGYPLDNVFIKDHGFDNPDFDNDTWEGRAKNRRVDIVLWPLPM